MKLLQIFSGRRPMLYYVCIVESESGKVGRETDVELSWGEEETARIEAMTLDSRVSRSPVMGSYIPTATGLIVETTKVTGLDKAHPKACSKRTPRWDVRR